MEKPTSCWESSGDICIRGARQNNLKNVNVNIPRDVIVVFTGVSGSGKSSLAFGTIFAEAQRRYLESVAPYARRLIDNAGTPEVESIEGLPPAVALQQRRGSPTARSSVGSMTGLSNLIRLLYSRAGRYPEGQSILYAEDFSPNTVQGACPRCQGLGRVFEVTEASLVPDDNLTIRERAVQAWPTAWGGQNLRDILVMLGHDIDVPWKTLPHSLRDWILFTDEQPTVPVYAHRSYEEAEAAKAAGLSPSYMGTFSSAKRHVLETFAHSKSARMRERAGCFMVGTTCPVCNGKRLKPEALTVTFAGNDIVEFGHIPLQVVAEILKKVADGKLADIVRAEGDKKPVPLEQVLAAQRLATEIVSRIDALTTLGLSYLSLSRATPTLSGGELQRLRLATQLSSHLFGVIYVLDEPSAGLHPADGEALIEALHRLKAAGNSVFVVEHDLATMREGDWIVDVGPGPGSAGGNIVYSGPPEGLADAKESITRAYLFPERSDEPERPVRTPKDWLEVKGVTRNNLRDVDVAFPVGGFTAVTGVSGSGKSSLVSQALVELVAKELGDPSVQVESTETQGAISAAAVAESLQDDDPGASYESGNTVTAGSIADLAGIRRLVQVDQKPIGRTPRSNLATYTGLFDGVRRLFAETPDAKRHRYGPGRFSFNVAGGRCPTCEGEGAVSIELLFLPSVYAPCPDCNGSRYNADTLRVRWKGYTIADVLKMSVDEAWGAFADVPAVFRSLQLLRDIGLGYLRLGQPATELSGGEAQRIKLATELQRVQRGDTLYVLDEPTTGLHPSDVDRLIVQLNGLVELGNTVVIVEHDMRVVAACDWLIDIGPGAADAGGRIVLSGPPRQMAAKKSNSKTTPYLVAQLDQQASKRQPSLAGQG